MGSYGFQLIKVSKYFTFEIMMIHFLIVTDTVFFGLFLFFLFTFLKSNQFEDFEIGGNTKIKRLERWLNIQKRNRRSWCRDLRFRVSYILVFSGSLKVEY